MGILHRHHSSYQIVVDMLCRKPNAAYGWFPRKKQTKTLRKRRNVILANWIFHGMIRADSLYTFKGIYKDIQIGSTLNEAPMDESIQ